MSYTLEHYPTRWIDVWHLPGGRRVTVRPVLPQDAELEQAMVRALSPASRHQRFFAPIRELPQGWLERLTQIDYRQHQALIAETFVGDQAFVVAEARFVVTASGHEAEFAVVVADDWRHLGLARRLLRALLRAAAGAGLQRLVGDVLATNQAMLSLAQSMAFQVVRHPDGGAQVLRVQKALTPADAADDAAETASAPTAPAPTAPAPTAPAPTAPAPSARTEWAAT